MSNLPDNVFRANVGAVLINRQGQVLALERVGMEGAWQLPQGGLDQGEAPLEAVYREVAEETGISRAQLAWLATCPRWLAYELPPDKRSGKHGRGQVQQWFLLRFEGELTAAQLSSVAEPEFSRCKWTTLAQLTQETAAFRQPLYAELCREFAPWLAQP